VNNCLGPLERLDVVVADAVMKASIASGSCRAEVKLAATHCGAAENAEPVFHLIQPQTPAPREMKVNAGLPVEPAITLRRVSFQVVEDDARISRPALSTATSFL